ncbi:MAG: hypothetical protein E7105_00195 [Prevotella sp.]|nr:hypothetical protein [Prevotella sp.]
MITDIIDLFVDASNTFGSFISFLRAKFKNYSVIVNNQHPLDSDVIQDINSLLPEIHEEITHSVRIPSYIVLEKFEVNGSKASINIVFLNEKCSFLHSFTLLKNIHIPDGITIPCYWSL